MKQFRGFLRRDTAAAKTLCGNATVQQYPNDAFARADPRCLHALLTTILATLCVLCRMRLTLLCLLLWSLQHLLLWRQRLLEKLHVEFIFLLHLLLFPQTHLIANIALEAEAQSHHRVADTGGTKIQ